MFDRFGEFNSAKELNETAVNMRKEGDMESIRILAEENGIDEELLTLFLDGTLLYLCDELTAAIGKLDIEKKALDCAEIMEDWVEYIKAQCLEKPEMALAVRTKKKKLQRAIGELLNWSFKHQHPVKQEIMKEAGVTAGKCTLGIPGMARAKKILTDYYLGK